MDTNNAQDIIKARFQELPPEIQKAITAADLPLKFDAISKKYTLRIDQSGDVQMETLLVMLGLEDSDKFVDNLVKNADLSREAATRIAADINTDIMGSIRETLQKLTAEEDVASPENEATNTDLQKAGGINVEKNLASADVMSVDPAKTSISPADREKVLNDIEHPPAFIDRLLSGPAASITETVIKQAPATPTSAATTPKPVPPTPTATKIDPYREPIE